MQVARGTVSSARTLLGGYSSFFSSLQGERAIDYLNTRPRLYVLDGFAGWDPDYRYKMLGWSEV